MRATDSGKAQKRYRETGFFVIESALDGAQEIADRITQRVAEESEIYVPEEARVVAAGRGFLRHKALDRFKCDEAAPAVGRLYADMLRDIREITQKELINSPYPRSAYYAKVYDPPDGQQGWHFDTNDVSVIVYLTSNPSDGGTEIQSLDGVTRVVQPVAGRILVLDGTACWHRAAPVIASRKTTLLLNYYTEPVATRDPRLDSIIFGED